MTVTFHPDGRTIVNGINRTPSLMVDSWRLTSGTGSAYNGDVGGGGNASPEGHEAHTKD